MTTTPRARIPGLALLLVRSQLAGLVDDAEPESTDRADKALLALGLGDSDAMALESAMACVGLCRRALTQAGAPRSGPIEPAEADRLNRRARLEVRVWAFRRGLDWDDVEEAAAVFRRLVRRAMGDET